METKVKMSYQLNYVFTVLLGNYYFPNEDNLTEEQVIEKLKSDIELFRIFCFIELKQKLDICSIRFTDDEMENFNFSLKICKNSKKSRIIFEFDVVYSEDFYFNKKKYYYKSDLYIDDI